MGKISKSDQDPHQTDKDKSELDKLLAKKSQHFAVGTRIVEHGRGAGEILKVLTCKCSKRETMLWVQWDDGSMSTTMPIALNR